MTADAMGLVFEDFNEPGEEAPAPPVEDVAPPPSDLGEIREEAWTDGYLTARQECGPRADDRPLTAKLLTSLHELDAKASQVVDAAALAVADLLANTVIAVTSDEWSARLLERVRMVADRVKPALTVAPEFMLRDDAGLERRFGDVTELARALEAGGGEDVTIRWQRGEATISRTALLEDLRDAIIPLSAGLADDQHVRQHT